MTIRRTASTLVLSAFLAVSAVALAQPPSVRMTGVWRFSCNTPRGKTRRISVHIKQDGSVLSGTFGGPRHPGRLSGDVQGDRVSLSLSGRRGSLSLSGTIADGTLNVRSARGVACLATRS